MYIVPKYREKRETRERERERERERKRERNSFGSAMGYIKAAYARVQGVKASSVLVVFVGALELER